MKKLAIGCGLALLVTGIAAAGVAYYVYRQVSNTVAQFAEFGKVADIERDVRKRVTFNPPSTEELTEAQLQKLVQVQAHIKQKLGEQAKMLEAKYKTLTDKKEATLADAPAILNAYRDLAKTWMDAKRSQVEALNLADLSLDEYRWIRHQAYRALGQPFLDLDLSKLMEDASRGIKSQAADLRGAIGPDGPEANRKLVEKFKKFLEDNIALASLGL
jgi:hypothetical protein